MFLEIQDYFTNGLDRGIEMKCLIGKKRIICDISLVLLVYSDSPLLSDLISPVNLQERYYYYYLPGKHGEIEAQESNIIRPIRIKGVCTCTPGSAEEKRPLKLMPCTPWVGGMGWAGPGRFGRGPWPLGVPAQPALALPACLQRADPVSHRRVGLRGMGVLGVHRPGQCQQEGGDRGAGDLGLLLPS